MSAKSDNSSGWVLAMVYVFTFPIAVSLVANWSNVPVVFRRLGTSEAASWVQAIGSIAAIWAGFAVARRQIDRAADEARSVERRRTAAKLRAATMAIKTAHTVAQAWVAAIDKANDRRVYARKSLDAGVHVSTRDLLKEISMADIDVPAAFDTLFAARGVFENVSILVGHTAESGIFDHEEAHVAVSDLERMFGTTARLAQTYDPDWFD